MPELRTEQLFIPDIGESLNVIIGHPKGHFVYRSTRRRIGEAMMTAGVQHLEPFVRPVVLEFHPKVARGRSGRMLKQFDCLNFGVTNKIIEDHLVKAGVLRDDNPDWVHGTFCGRAEESSDGAVGILLVIREVDAPAIGVQGGLALTQEAAF